VLSVAQTPLSTYLGFYPAGWAYQTDGRFWNNNVEQTGNPTSSSGDVVMVAFDMDNGKIWFGKNGTWFSSGNPATGANAIYSNLSGTLTPAFSVYNNGSGFSANFGQRPFAYAPPSGFLTLNTRNLPTPTIGATASTTANKYFDASLYTGNGSSVTVTNSGGMQPDLVWAKSRSGATNNCLIDSVRGISTSLFSDTTDFELYFAGYYVTSFNSNGFTVGLGTGVNANAATYVGWQWKESVSAGFDILTYTGNGGTGASSQYVNHSLGVTPNLIITKVRSSGATYPSWYVYHSAVQSGNFAYYGLLNSTAAWSSGSSPYQLWTANSTQIAFNETANESGKDYVAYVFAQVAGYSAFGSYTGNGSTDGPFVYTGFRPKFVMVKCSSNSTSSTVWVIFDTSRSPYNAAVLELYPNSTAAEGTDSNGMDILSNGFKPKRNSEYLNLSGWTYIYMAVAENPFKFSLAR
jgi:hypothetical protein